MAAMRKPKVELSTEQRLIDQAIKEGRCTLQDVSMKQLEKPDPRLQPRVDQINVDHVRKLAAIRKLQGWIAPIVVFDDEEVKKMHVASGRHRHEEHRIAKEASIRAYVIKGDWNEAMEFAAATNQETLLERSPQDIEKQVSMLLEIPKWFTMTDAQIAAHVGVGGPIVRKVRLRFSRDRGVANPEYLTNAAGKKVPFAPALNKKKGIYPIMDKNGTVRYKTVLKGKSKFIGSTMLAAEDSLARIAAEKDLRRKRLEFPTLSRFLLARNLVVEAFAGGTFATPNLHGFFLPGCICTVARLDRGGQELNAALGRLVQLRHIKGTLDRLVVVCIPDDCDGPSLSLASSAGFEFLSPEEIVASIKGADHSS